MNRKTDRKQQILDAALRVFARYGYRRARVEDVADELGMTKGNLYLYVSGKKDLHDQAVAHGLTRWQSKVAEVIAPIEDPVERFRTLCLSSYEYLSEDATLRTIITDDPTIFTLSPERDRFRAINQTALTMLQDTLSEGVRQGRFRDIDVDSMAASLFSIYVMYIIKTGHNSEEFQSIRKMYRDTLDILLHGLIRPDRDNR